MFAVDIPPELNVEMPQIILVQEQPEGSTISTIGVSTVGTCFIGQNPAPSYANSMLPSLALNNYLRNVEGRDVDYRGAESKIIQEPQHGFIEFLQTTAKYGTQYRYVPEKTIKVMIKSYMK